MTGKIVLLCCCLIVACLPARTAAVDVLPAEALEARLAELKGQQKVLVSVEVHAASHVGVLLAPVKELLRRGHSVVFLAPESLGHLMPVHGLLQFVPLPSPPLNHSAFHGLYTSAHPGGEPAFLCKHLLLESYVSAYPIVSSLLYPSESSSSPFSLVVVDLFSWATSDLLRYGPTPQSSAPWDPPQALASMPAAMGAFGWQWEMGLPTGLLAEMTTSDRSLWWRAADLLALAQAISATAAGLPFLDATRARFGYPASASLQDVFTGRPAVSFMYFGLDYARLLPPSVRVLSPSLVPFRAPSPADAPLLARLDALHAASRPVVYMAFGSIAYPTALQFRSLLLGALSAHPSAFVLAVIPSHLHATYLSTLSHPPPPSSFHLESWVHQQAVLRHPAVSVFVTHGGLMSITESCAASKPMLVFPFYGDQPGNAARLTEAGAGLPLSQHRHSPEAVAPLIARLLSEPHFAANAARLDQMRAFIKPEQRFADFAEELILFGSDHLFPPADRLSLVQRYSIDILFAILASVLVVLATLVYFARAICRRSFDRG